MNDERDPLPHIRFDTIGAEVGKEHERTQREQRGWRRAAAMNAVQMARVHAGKSDNDAYSGDESDILFAIVELLEKVARG